MARHARGADDVVGGAALAILAERGLEIPVPLRDVHIRTGVSPLHVVQGSTSDEKAQEMAPRAR
jgi:hypothetical protein